MLSKPDMPAEQCLFLVGDFPASQPHAAAVRPTESAGKRCLFWYSNQRCLSVRLPQTMPTAKSKPNSCATWLPLTTSTAAAIPPAALGMTNTTY